MSERDLAAAIHHEIISPQRVDAALATWNQNQHLDPRKRMWIVLANASGLSCDTVLARRLSEAARTGPWEGNTREQQEEIIAQAIEASMFASHELPLSKALHDKYLLTAAHVLDALAAAEPAPSARGEREACARDIEALAVAIRDNGPTTPEGLLTAIAGAQVGALLDAAASLRLTRDPSPWAGGHHFQEEDGYPGSLLPPKRGAP